MRKSLSLIQHCRDCSSKCCVGQSGAPRIDLKEKIIIEQRFGKNNLTEEKGYWVPRKVNEKCIFLDRALCSLQEIKPVDCRLFPLDPIFAPDGSVDFVIDENCPATQHLTPEFYHKAIKLGTSWMSETDPETFQHYWNKYKANNYEQRLTKLSEYLKSRPDEFVAAIRRGLITLPGLLQSSVPL